MQNNEYLETKGADGKLKNETLRQKIKKKRYLQK